MKKEIRTFIAVRIIPGKKLVEQLNHFKQTFWNERINWVDSDNFHLTLRFLGNTTREQLYQLVDCLGDISVGLDSFDLHLKGVGYFKSKGQPHVLFVKIDESNHLIRLVEKVEKSGVAFGFNEELIPFRPHLTLGRIKFLQNKTKFFSIVDELANTEYQYYRVSKFILFQSILHQEGPQYKIIREFELK